MDEAATPLLRALELADKEDWLEATSGSADDSVVVTPPDEYAEELYTTLEAMLIPETSGTEPALPLLAVSRGLLLPPGLIVTGSAVIVVMYGLPDED